MRLKTLTRLHKRLNLGLGFQYHSPGFGSEPGDWPPDLESPNVS